MLTLITLHKEPRAQFEAQGERSFWAWSEWGERYFRRWYAATERYIPAPKQYAAPLDGARPGWWNKIRMFSPAVSSGICLYSDLDNVISGPLDALCALTPAPIIMADDKYYPGLPNGSLMLFDADAPVLRALWDEYEANPAAIEAEFAETKWPHASDQAFIADRVRKAGYEIPLFQDLLPPHYLLMAKELESGAEWQDTHIVCGQGVPKPHQSPHAFYEAWK